MKIGLFFGSFNPVHVGHMAIANYMVEFTDLEQVWLVVSPHNPLKNKSTLLGDHHRLQLVQTAIGDHPKLKASSIEFKLPQPSYTVHTLAYLKEKYPEHLFVLIMGTDNLKTLPRWKNYEEILNGHEIYVYPRAGEPEESVLSHPHIKRVEAPLMQISSSFIRSALKSKKDIRFFLSGPVYDYIREMHFYEK